MEWSEDFESGLADIDVQHRYIFALTRRVSELQDEITQSSNRVIVEELVSFAHCHFECEERLMAAYNYPESAKHVAEHTRLQLELKKYLDYETIDPRQFSLLLCNWIVSHTLMEDRQLALHVLEVRAAILGTSVEEFAKRVFTSYHPSAVTVVPSEPLKSAAGD